MSKKTNFESPEFSEKFEKTLAEYNEAIDNDKEPPLAAKEFMDAMFDSNIDDAFDYQLVLDNMKDQSAARQLQDIVFNSGTSMIS